MGSQLGYAGGGASEAMARIMAQRQIEAQRLQNQQHQNEQMALEQERLRVEKNQHGVETMQRDAQLQRQTADSEVLRQQREEAAQEKKDKYEYLKQRAATETDPRRRQMYQDMMAGIPPTAATMNDPADLRAIIAQNQQDLEDQRHGNKMDEIRERGSESRATRDAAAAEKAHTKAAAAPPNLMSALQGSAQRIIDWHTKGKPDAPRDPQYQHATPEEAMHAAYEQFREELQTEWPQILADHENADINAVLAKAWAFFTNPVKTKLGLPLAVSHGSVPTQGVRPFGQAVQ